MGKSLILMTAIIAAMTSCTLRELTEVSGMNETVKVDFIIGSPVSKGVVEGMLAEKAGISDLKIAVYDEGGLLFHEDYYEKAGTGTFSAELYHGCRYTAFVMGNVGNEDVPLTMEEMRSHVYEIGDISGLVRDGMLPMSAEFEIDTAEKTEYAVSLKSLAAEISLRFECPEDLTIELQSVQFRSVPMTITPFSPNTAPVRRADGDGDAAGECLKLHDGEAVAFLVPEDMSSANVLPPDSSEPPSPWTDFPENIPYMEITGKIVNTAGLKTADIEYRILLDYKIERNRRYDVTFSVTEAGIFEVSYRVDVKNAELDLETDRLDLFVGKYELLYCKVMNYDVLEYTVADPSVAAVDLLGGVYGLRRGTTTVTVYSPVLDAEAVCEVTVRDPTDDYVSLGELKNLFVAQTVDIPFNATFGGDLTLTVNTGAGPEDLYMDLRGGDDVRSAENEYVRIDYDPVGYFGTGKKSIRLTLIRRCAFDMEIESVSGKKVARSGQADIPGIEVQLERTSLKEDEYTAFSAVMSDGAGGTLTKEDFNAVLYERYYGDVEVSIADNSVADVWEYDPDTGEGKIAALSAGTSGQGITVNVSASYSGTVGYKDPDAAVLSVHPVFGEVPSDLGIVENRVFLTYNGKYNKSFTSFADVEDLPESEIRLRHLQWDRIWENGTDAPSTELRVHNINAGTERTLTLEFGMDGSGPYAVRFVRTNPLTGREYYREVKMDVCLMLECGPYVEWDEGSMFECNVRMIWNLHPTSSSSELVAAFPQSSSDKYIRLSYTGDPTPSPSAAPMRNYAIGDFIRDWVPQRTFAELSMANPDARACEVFRWGILGPYDAELYDPFKGRNAPDRTYYYTDREFAEAYYDGKPYLFGVTLHNSGGALLKSLLHCCSWASNYPSGYDSDLYGRYRY